MKNFIRSILLAAGIACFSLSAFAQPPGSGWTNVFADEFNGNGVNTSIWDVKNQGVFKPGQVQVYSGTMKILNTYTASGEIRGGWLGSKDKFTGNNKYGYYEARVRVVGWSKGAIWPTWWIWGGNWRNGGPAPTATELDLMEYSGFSAKWYNNKATSSHHYKAKQVINGKTHATTPYANAQQRDQYSWHRWGLLWTPTEVTFYYDGVPYFSSDQPGNAASENVPMQLLLTSSPHTANADPSQPDHPTPADAAKPGQNLPHFEVDWVRVWQGGSVGGGGSGNAVVMRKGNATNFAIDGNNGGANGQNVYLWTANNSNVNQQWEEIDRGNGYYSYKKKNTNYCLDGGNGGANGQNVYLWTCSSNNQNQHWKKVNVNGKYRLEKRNAPAYSIDGNNGGADGQNLYLWSSSNGNQNQLWQFQNSSARQADVVAEMELSTNLLMYPNPADGEVTFEFTLPTDGAVSMQVLDLGGKEVAQLVDAEYAAGTHRIKWQPESGAEGTYIVRLKTLTDVKSSKLILVK